MLFKKQIRKGFTLVEMMLYVGICSVLLLSLSVALSFILSARVKNQTVSEVNQSGTQVMQLVTQTIRNAKSVNNPTLGLSSSTLSIKTMDATKDPTVFDLASGTIRIKEGNGQYIPLTNKRVIVSGLVFKNTSASSTDGGSIEINFTITHINLGNTNEFSFSKTLFGSASFH